MEKTTWHANAGKMVFLMPDRSQYEAAARYIDHPDTLSRLIDEVYRLNPVEQNVLFAIMTRRRL